MSAGQETRGFGKADDLKVLEEFSLSLAHVIVRLKRAVDHILSLHKLALERLDSAPSSERQGCGQWQRRQQHKAQKATTHTLVLSSARALQREAACGMQTPELGACLALLRRQLHAFLALSLAFALLSPLPTFL